MANYNYAVAFIFAVCILSARVNLVSGRTTLETLAEFDQDSCSVRFVKVGDRQLKLVARQSCPQRRLQVSQDATGFRDQLERGGTSSLRLREIQDSLQTLSRSCNAYAEEANTEEKRSLFYRAVQKIIDIIERLAMRGLLEGRRGLGTAQVIARIQARFRD